MNVKDFRNLFFVCSVVLVFFAISPTLNLLLNFYVEESFSELSLLGPNHVADDYPFNLLLNHEERLFVKVGNHMGESSYYRVFVKFRNQTQSQPSKDDPSLLAPLYEYRVFLLDSDVWEGEIKFTFLEVTHGSEYVQINKMMINNVILELDSISMWDSEYQGYYFQLFFELWYYDVGLDRFNYYDQGFVGVWLNMTI